MKLKHVSLSIDREKEGYQYQCPACGIQHFVVTKNPGGPTWLFNDDLNKPTVQPSLRVQWNDQVCHHFITDGKLHFLADCTHDLAGQTVDMEDIDES